MQKPIHLPLQVLMMPDYRADNPYQALLAEHLQQEGVEVHFPTGYRRVLPLLRAVRDCSLREGSLGESSRGVQVLHLHWINPYTKGKNWLQKVFYSLKLLLDVFLVRLTGTQVVWTIHNQLSHEAPFPRLERWTVRQLVKLADRLIVHHEAARTELSELYRFKPDKASVIPHGHYRTVYGKAIGPAEARAILGLPETGRVYLNLGMLRPYKGIERLLQLWRDHPEVTAHRLLIAGKPLDEAYQQQLAQQVAETKGAILHSGFVEDRLIPVYYSAADVVVLPFENILTSGSLILAMSYGKPVIAPQIGSIPETLGAADSLLYDPTDEQGLLKAIQHSTEIDLDSLGQLTSEMGDRLDWDKIAQQTAQLYAASNCSS